MQFFAFIYFIYIFDTHYNTNFMKIFLQLFFIIGMLTGAFAQNPGNQKLILKDWRIQNSHQNNKNGAKISSPDFNDKTWVKTEVPSTVFNALVKSGNYKDVYLGKNMEQISKEPFKVSWWYRSSFDIKDTNLITLLNFKGINYSANIWLNGTLIASKNEVINPFRQFKFQINQYIHKGKNTLAIEVFPPEPGDFTIGFVDWNPAPPDNNMGITRNVEISFNKGVGINDPYIEPVFKNGNYTETDLIFTTELQNYGNNKQGYLLIKIGDITIEKKIKLLKNEHKKVVLTTSDFKELHINNPKLWWPHTLGEPYLYPVKVSFTINNQKVDVKEFKFGIREVSDFFTAEGHRGFKINGHKISIRGGGWVDNMMLDDTPEYIKAQLDYVKDMNLNTIRLEGFWGKDQTMYDLCDQMGILIMVGWSCQWEWENYLGKPVDETYGGITAPRDIELMSKAWKDQVVWLRNHPSIFTWFAGSDCIPAPQLEKKYFNIFHQYDSTRVYLSSAKEWTSLSGPSGVKMRGPYAYVPPVYWYKDTLYGGAFGFNTETGPGAQVPPLESIKKMIPKKDLWPINDVWNYHCGRNEFNTLTRYTKAINKRYGRAENVEDYAFKAQILNYELMRPMFEAFSINRYKATGVIQWMLNSAWPEMYWQLYDTYLMPNGAYYGAKKAGKPIQAMYNYGNRFVYLVNDRLQDSSPLMIEIKILDLYGNVKSNKIINTDIKANSSKKLIEITEPEYLTDTYFLSLKILDNKGKEITDNFYWLSKKEDILDYKAKVPNWYYYTPTRQYADFTALNQLQKIKLTHSITQSNDKDYSIFNIELKNSNNTIAFFIEMKIADEETGLSILPVIWSDNYISLLPGEKKVFTARIRKNLIENKKIKFKFKGWNVEM